MLRVESGSAMCQASALHSLCHLEDLTTLCPRSGHLDTPILSVLTAARSSARIVAPAHACPSPAPPPLPQGSGTRTAHAPCVPHPHPSAQVPGMTACPGPTTPRPTSLPGRARKKPSLTRSELGANDLGTLRRSSQGHRKGGMETWTGRKAGRPGEVVRGVGRRSPTCDTMRNEPEGLQGWIWGAEGASDSNSWKSGRRPGAWTPGGDLDS